MAGLTAGGAPVYRDSAGHLFDKPDASASSVSSVMTGTELDTNGNPVPVFKAHTYVQDAAGNTLSDTVSDGMSTWVRTYTYVMGALQSDSGWVKQ